MEYIQINCDECSIDKHLGATLVDFNYDVIKNIIESKNWYNFYIIDCPNYTKPAI